MIMLVSACGDKKTPDHRIPVVAAPAGAPHPGSISADSIPADAGQAGPPVLLAADWDAAGVVYLSPIGTFGDSGLKGVDVGEDGDSSFELFSRTYFRRGQDYALYSRGVQHGVVRVSGVSPGACSGIVALAQPPTDLRGILNDTMVRLATNRNPDWTAPVPLRPLSPAQRQTVFRAMSDTLKALPLPDTLRGSEAAVAGWAIPTAHGDTTLLVATMTTQVPDSEGEHVVSLWYVLEVGGGEPRVAFREVFDEHEADVVSFALVDAVDMKRDGWPEIIALTEYYESHDFRILHRKAGRWMETYRGGGAGC